MRWFFQAKHETNVAPLSDQQATTVVKPAASTLAGPANATPLGSRRRLFGVAGLGALITTLLTIRGQNADAATTNGIFSSSTSGTPAVKATGTNGAHGVQASSDSGYGLYGKSTSNYGIFGSSTSNYGVQGTSTNNAGVSWGK